MIETPNPSTAADFEARIERLRTELLALGDPAGLGGLEGLLYNFADDLLDQAADELDLVFGEEEAKAITGAEAAGINAYIEAANRILKAAHSD